MKRLIRAADLFCGAGGTSTGLQQACEKLDYRLDLFAVNHWDLAIATHSTNHPDARHMCASLDAVDPRKSIPGGRLDLLWASPECTHHSIARGGQPVSDQGRASAWLILRWAETLHIDTILIENVPEFRTWGPIGANGRPMKSRRGETFSAFIRALESLGYTVDWEILNAADYGDPTTRRRLFIQARRGRQPIAWPKRTHSKMPGTRTVRWRPARDIIDWTIPGQSIFGRKKPLAQTTIRRIITGLERFGGTELQPFIVVLRRHADARSIDDPVPTLTAGGNHVGIAQPFILAHRMFKEDCVDSIEHPLRTMTAKGAGDFGLVEPFLTRFNGDHGARGDGSRRVQSVDDPIGTLDTSNRYGLAEPFLLQLTHGGRVHGIDSPVPTITTAHRGETGIVSPLIAKYYGTGQCRPVTEPLDTITAKDRFGLVMPVVNGHALDIHFRMLHPRELAAAMGFDRDYQFTGNREAVVKQIGNAVAVNTAQALCEAVLG